MDLSKIPKPLLVFGVLFLGVVGLIIFEPPHTRCDSQLEGFKETQVGFLYPKKIKDSVRPPLWSKLIESCKLGNSAGSCYEFFNSLKKLVRDAQNIPSECSESVDTVPEIKKALTGSLSLMVRMAWGEKPPASPAERFNWLEASDLALFCQLRDQWVRLWGQDSWNEFRLQMHTQLPAEAPVFEGAECTNCDSRKKASEALTPEEIWNLSLFSVRCDQYR